MIYSFCRRHDNYLSDFDYPSTKEDCRLALQKRYGDGIVFLGYYEHGDCVWYVEGEGGPGTQCPFDGVSFAGVWVPSRVQRAVARRAMKRNATTMADELKVFAKLECEQLTRRFNGEEN